MKGVMDYDYNFGILYGLNFYHIRRSGYADGYAGGDHRNIAFLQIIPAFRRFKRMIKQLKNVFFVFQYHRNGSKHKI